VGWGRWTNGSIIVVDENGSSSTEIETLTDNKSIHFVFGPDLGTFNPVGGAQYNFVGGTQSTSASGSTIGNGITSGYIYVYFESSWANINMTVDHIPGFPYTVSGSLSIYTSDNMIMDYSVSASTSAPDSACNSTTCTTSIYGGFTGPIWAELPDFPGYIGIGYDIQDTEVIMGVGGFKLDLDTFSIGS